MFFPHCIPKTCSKELIVVTKCGFIKNPGEMERQKKVASVSLLLCFFCSQWVVPPPQGQDQRNKSLEQNSASGSCLEELGEPLSHQGDMQGFVETIPSVWEAVRSQGWLSHPWNHQWLHLLCSFLLLIWELQESHIKYVFNMFFPLGHKQRVLAVSLC